MSRLIPDGTIAGSLSLSGRRTMPAENFPGIGRRERGLRPLVKNCKSDVEKVVAAAYFHPLGERGVCRYVRSAKYSSIDKFSYFQKANDDCLVIVHVEGMEGLGNLTEILEVEGLDVVFLGPYDLSQSCGIPGEIDHPQVKKVMNEAVELAKQNGKIVGTFVESVESAKSWIDCGVQYISYSVDVGIYYEACSKIVKQLKNINIYDSEKVR